MPRQEVWKRLSETFVNRNNVQGEPSLHWQQLEWPISPSQIPPFIFSTESSGIRQDHRHVCKSLNSKRDWCPKPLEEECRDSLCMLSVTGITREPRSITSWTVWVKVPMMSDEGPGGWWTVLGFLNVLFSFWMKVTLLLQHRLGVVLKADLFSYSSLCSCWRRVRCA